MTSQSHIVDAAVCWFETKLEGSGDSTISQTHIDSRLRLHLRPRPINKILNTLSRLINPRLPLNLRLHGMIGNKRFSLSFGFAPRLHLKHRCLVVLGSRAFLVLGV